MEATSTLPVLAVVVVAVGSVAFGPLGPVELSPATRCSEQVFPGDGNATVTADVVPESGTLSRSAFGAAVWRLEVPSATVKVADVRGRPTVSFRLQLDGLDRAVGTTAVLSRCTTDPVELSLPRTTFDPATITEDRYEGTVTVVYRGTENGTAVERVVARRNVTVGVDGDGM